MSFACVKRRRTVHLQGLNSGYWTKLRCELADDEQVDFCWTYRPLISTLADLGNNVGLFAGG